MGKKMIKPLMININKSIFLCLGTGKNHAHFSESILLTFDNLLFISHYLPIITKEIIRLLNEKKNKKKSKRVSFLFSILMESNVP